MRYRATLEFFLASVLLSIGNSGCLKPELTKRHDRIVPSAGVCTEAGAALAAFSIPTPGAGSSSGVTDLDGRGQKALIQAVAATSPDSLFEELGKRFSAPAARPTVEHANRFQRTVVLSVDHKAAGAADRIREARITLTPEGADFLSWDRFVTEFGSVDLGKITAGQSRTSSLEASIGAPQVPEGLSVKPRVEVSRSLNEEVQLKQRYVTLTGILDADRAEVIQQGTTGIDLAGNVTLALSVAVTPLQGPVEVTEFSGLSAGGGPSRQADVRFRLFEVHVPTIPGKTDPIQAAAKLAYEIRHVTKNARTISEGDDHVALCSGEASVEGNFTLVPVEDMKFSTWHLSAEGAVDADRDPPATSATYSVEVPRRPSHDCSTDDRVELGFRSAAAADDLLTWLSATTAARPDEAVQIANRPLCQCLNRYRDDAWVDSECGPMRGLLVPELYTWEHRVNWQPSSTRSNVRTAP